MSTSASIKKIKIPSLNSNALPRKNARPEPTSSADPDILVDIAKLLVRKYKILPKWDNSSRMGLFDELKTKSESKCVIELYRLCKKSQRKQQSVSDREEKPKATKTIFRETKKNKNSSKKKKKLSIRKKKPEDGQEHTITESAQRSA